MQISIFLYERKTITMKKSLSIVLALVLCLCACAPAFAAEATFSYTGETYVSMFDLMLQIAAKSTSTSKKNVLGGYTISALDNEVIVACDANDSVESVTIKKQYSLASLGDFQDDAYAIGQLLACMSLASVASTDMNALSEDGIDGFTQDLVALIQTTISKLDFDKTNSVATDSVSYAGTTITCTYTYSSTTGIFSMEFVATPTK